MPVPLPEAFLNRLNPRVKLILTLAFILALSLSPAGAWPAFILFLSVLLSAAVFLRVGIPSLMKRALLALPLILAAVPLVFTGPAPYLPVGLPFNISLAGTERFLSIAVKSWLSLQAAILFSSTTSYTDMLVAFRSLGTPRIFVAIIGLMWRYLSVLQDEVVRLMRGRSSRSSILPTRTARRPGGSLVWRASIAGGMVGSLLLRGLERSDRVYSAMLARGYNGEPPFYHVTALTTLDRRRLIVGLGVILFLLSLSILTGGL